MEDITKYLKKDILKEKFKERKTLKVSDIDVNEVFMVLYNKLDYHEEMITLSSDYYKIQWLGMMPLDEAPILFRIPISRVFSITIIMSELTMLNAATIIMRQRITNAPHFSMVIQLYKLLFSSNQVRATKGYPPTFFSMIGAIFPARL